MVYEPAEDTELLARNVQKLAYGKTLDMGSGNGIQAQAALFRTKEVTCVDVDPDAVSHLKRSLENYSCQKRYSNKGTYDMIIFNPHICRRILG